MYDLKISTQFAAAHQLRGLEGGCENLHGHTWKTRIYLQGSKLGKEGMLMDFKEIKKILNQVLDIFDHQCLNKLDIFDGISPTSENVAKIVFEMIRPKIGQNVKLTKVEVFESDVTSATYWE